MTGIPKDLECEVLHETKWLSLLRLRNPALGVHGYVCTHANWTNGQAVAVLPWRINEGRVECLLRREITPCWGMEPELSAITGGMDVPDESPIECVVRELHEESGYRVHQHNRRWTYFGARSLSKSSTTVVHMFIVDLTDMEPGVASGDGSELENQAACEWHQNPADAVDVLVPALAFSLRSMLSRQPTASQLSYLRHIARIKDDHHIPLDEIETVIDEVVDAGWLEVLPVGPPWELGLTPLGKLRVQENQ